jgi:DNA invertase Pin-like site-specific DNA recombinase
MPTAYFYARVSTIDQALNGHSLKDQKRVLKRIYRRTLKPEGYARGPLLRDPGVSAWRFRLFDRADGQKLQMKSLSVVGLLEPGDCVVIDKLNRAFRNVKDIATTIDYWRKNNVRVIIRQFEGIDTGSAMGTFMLHIFGAIAQFESDMKSEMIRERNAIARQQGTPIGQVPVGWKIKRSTTRGKPNKLVPDWRQRGVMAYMLELERAGYKHAEIKRMVLERHRVYAESMMQTLLTARELEILAAIKTHGNANRAAKALGVNKSTVIRARDRALRKLPPAPLEDGLDVSIVGKWLAAAKKLDAEGVLHGAMKKSDQGKEGE